MADEPIPVLIMEDDLSFRRLAQSIVESRGHRVEVVTDAESAWTAFERECHPLIVLDWKLPGMDGVETEGQLALLQNLGCDLGQGYLISRPLDPARAETLIKKRGSLL